MTISEKKPPYIRKQRSEVRANPFSEESLMYRTRQVYYDMRNRCLNPNHSHFYLWGGRGIEICQRWMDSIDNFISDMGPKPHGLTLERKDNNAGYSPDNCCWATRRDQIKNQRTSKLYTFDGQKRTLPEIAASCGLTYQSLQNRLNRGFSIEEAATLPRQTGGPWGKNRKIESRLTK